jgi:hypothetical protein
MKQTIDIDIVDRLRINWTSLTDTQNAERNEAADEIERLRAERDEARKLVVEFIYKGTARKRDIAKARGWTDLYPDDDYDMEGDVE